jgi:adenosylhomocysteine nucleosidase
MMKIALFSALPQEYGCFKRLVGSWRPLSRKPFRSFVGSVAGKELMLIETGMGRGGLREAFRWSMGMDRPDLIVSMGFAGGLCPQFEVGRVLLGNRFIYFTLSPASSTPEALLMEIDAGLEALCLRGGIAVAQVVTVDRPESKPLTRGRFAGTPSIMDMESYFLCRYSLEEGIPFLSLRAVSDGVDDELAFDVEAISDSAGKARISKVISAVMKEPGLIRSFLVAWQRSSRAAEQLARALVDLLSVPENDLRRMVQASRLPRGRIEDNTGP